MFEELRFCRVRFEFALERPLVAWPRNAAPGDILHKVFVRGLHRRVCPCRPDQQCSDCESQTDCVFSYIILTPQSGTAELSYRRQNHPHPYVIEPPETDAAGRDGRLEFSLVLIGRAMAYLPLFVRALSRVQIGGVRGELRVVRDLLSEPPAEVYSRKTMMLRPPRMRYGREFLAPVSSERVVLRFLTPARITCDGRVVSSLDFRTLVARLVHRFEALSECHCAAQADCDKDELLAAAAAVRVGRSSLREVSAGRASSGSTGEDYELGGLVGEMEFVGPVGRFAGLLRLGELLHVGNGTTKGQGWYRIVAWD